MNRLWPGWMLSFDNNNDNNNSNNKTVDLFSACLDNQRHFTKETTKQNLSFASNVAPVALKVRPEEHTGSILTLFPVFLKLSLS